MSPKVNNFTVKALGNGEVDEISNNELKKNNDKNDQKNLNGHIYIYT
jgi:hypothetical protein